MVGDFFAFKNQEAGVGATEVSGAADEVITLGTAAIDNLVFVGSTDGSYGDDHATAAGCGVAADEIDIVAFAATADAVIQFLDSLDGIAVADGDADKNLQGDAVHGGNVAEASRHGLVAKVLEGCVHHIELNPLGHGFGVYEDLLMAGADYGAVVADAFDGTFILGFKVLLYALDESKFAKTREFGATLVGIFQLFHQLFLSL